MTLLDKLKKTLILGKATVDRISQVGQNQETALVALASAIPQADLMRTQEIRAEQQVQIDNSLLEKQNLDSGLALVVQGIGQIEQGLSKAGIDPLVVEADIRSELGLGTQKVILDPTTRVIVLGQQTDTIVSPRGRDLITNGFINPGETVDLGSLTKRIYGDERPEPPTVAKLIRQTNETFSPYVPEAVTRVDRGFYQLDPNIETLGVRAEPIPNLDKKPLVDIVSLGDFAGQRGIQYLRTARLVRNLRDGGVLEDSVHLKIKPLQGGKERIDLTPEGVKLLTNPSVAKTFGPDVLRPKAADVASAIRILKGQEVPASPKPDEIKWQWVKDAHREYVGRRKTSAITHDTFNYLEEMGYLRSGIDVKDTPSGKKRCFKLTPEFRRMLNKLDSAAKSDGISVIRKSFIRRVLGEVGTVETASVSDIRDEIKEKSKIVVRERIVADRLSRLIPQIREELKNPAWAENLGVEIDERVLELKTTLAGDHTLGLEAKEMSNLNDKISELVNQMTKKSNDVDEIQRLAGDSEGLKLLGQVLVDLRRTNVRVLAKFSDIFARYEYTVERDLHDTVVRKTNSINSL